EEEAMAASAAAAAAHSHAHGHHLPWQQKPHLAGGGSFLMGAPTSVGPPSASMSAPHLLITSSASGPKAPPPGLNGLGAAPAGHGPPAPPGSSHGPLDAMTGMGTNLTTGLRFDALAPGEGAVRPGTSNSISGYPGLLAGRHR